MKFLNWGLFLCLVLALGACEIKITNENLEKAITLEEEGEYEKSILLLGLVLEENNEHKEANCLYTIISDYVSAKNLYEEGQLEEAKQVINQIDSQYMNYQIKEDVDNLNEMIEHKLSIYHEIEHYLVEAKSLLESEEFDDCIMYLKVHLLGTDTISSNLQATESQLEQAEQLITECEKRKIDYYLTMANTLFNEERYPQCIEIIQEYIMNNSYASLEQVEAASKLMDVCQEVQLSEDVVINESYAIDQIMKLPTIKELTNQGTDVKFMIEEDAIVNQMTGYSIQVYEYQLDHIATIGWYFLEYKSGDLYRMNIAVGEYKKVG
ncbi:MAG: hypothetical protein IIZ99_01000 [Turicibacter sp.]|nr:hypothetical protein [Turicibacter sp.]